jgi:putative endonuclease
VTQYPTVKGVRQCNVGPSRDARNGLCEIGIDAVSCQLAGIFTLMLAARQLLGEKGERIAESWLARRGWTLVERRFRSGHRDIDLVVERNSGPGGPRIVAFVEVKTRASSSFGGPLGAVDWRKQRELVRAARDWMSRFHRQGDVYRFDVVGVVFGAGGPDVIHVENAFSVK